ncbi:MAG TPA: SRPBCC family protein [Bacteroidia bacterium]|nr:SRPBCC family protein [Bacteroidia bacterium]
MTTATVITVGVQVNAPVEKVWQLWTSPEHIVKWNSPSDDWHTPRATNDLRVGGRFVSHMAAKDGSMGFDFGGTYTEVKTHQLIKYTMDDNRKATVTFTPNEKGVQVTVEFDAETINPVEMQRGGWQAISDNFKKYAEL